MKNFAFFSTVLLVTGLGLRAQTPTMKCNDDGGNNRARSCEIREITQPASSRLTVDGGQNGGITIKGADRGDILVRAKVEGWAADEASAKAVAAQVNVHALGGSVTANGPNSTAGRDQGWAVSYEIFVPRQIALGLQANNGGIAISNVSGALEFHTINGGVHLTEVGGDVKGDTKNGGVSVALSGNRWNGTGLDVQTQNGGVSIKVPEQFSAQFEASTVNGGMSVGLPNVTLNKRDRNVNVTLGSGGPPIRVRTQNGGVSVSKV